MRRACSVSARTCAKRRLAGPDRAFDAISAVVRRAWPQVRKGQRRKIRRYHGRAAKKPLTWNPMLAALVTVGATGILAAGACTYAAIAPESQLFGRTVIAGRDPAEFALTYDMGPMIPGPRLCSTCLARHNLRATFLSDRPVCAAASDLVREIRDAGHLDRQPHREPSLAGGAEPAPRPRRTPGCNAALERFWGSQSAFFAASRVAASRVLRAARDLGLHAVMWNAMGFDWRANHPRRARFRAILTARGFARNQRGGRGSNLLLHDGGHLAMAQTFAIRRGYAPHSRASTRPRKFTTPRWTRGPDPLRPATLPFVPKLAKNPAACGTGIVNLEASTQEYSHPDA